MAIEIEIPRDISKYEAKFAGPLTTRQVVCGVPGAAIAVGAYFLFKSAVPSDFAIFIAILLSLPLFLCGWVKMYGVPFEKYASIIFTSVFLAPKHRKYRSENTYRCLKQCAIEQNTKKKAKGKTIKKKKYTGEFKRYE